MPEKCCTQCQQSKPLEEFGVSKRASDGHQSECLACHRQQNKRHYANNRPAVLTKNAKWRAANPERMAEDLARWLLENPQRRKAIQSRYRAKHRAKANAMTNAWHKAHPQAGADKTARYRARLHTAPVVETIDREAIYARDGWICQLCHTTVPRKQASLDHVIPLSKGGEHTTRNLVLVHARCNSGKGNRPVPQQQRLF